MSALFDFNAFLTVVLLTICTCTYIKMKAPAVLAQKTGCAPRRSFLHTIHTTWVTSGLSRVQDAHSQLLQYALTLLGAAAGSEGCSGKRLAWVRRSPRECPGLVNRKWPAWWH